MARLHLVSFFIVPIAVFLHSCYPPPSVSMAEIPPLPEPWANEPIIVIEDSTTIHLVPGPDGNQLQVNEYRWFYVNKVTPAFLKSIRVYDSESIETPPEIDCIIVYPDSTKRSISKRDMNRSHGSEGDALRYNRWVHELSYFQTTFAVPYYSAGINIHLRVRRTFTSPQFVDRFRLRGFFPIMHKHIRFESPRGSALRIALNNPESLAVTVDTSIDSSMESFSIDARNLEEMSAKNQCKYPEQWFASLELSLPHTGTHSLSWAELGDSYLQSISSVFDVSETIHNAAQRFCTDTDTCVLDSAFLFVRDNIRYYGNWKDIYSFIPRSSESVLANGYGDCKEMAMLLVNLLQARGVDAMPALVSTAGNPQVHDDFPSLGGFNHMVCAVKRNGNKIQILDPTNTFARAHTSYYSLIGQKCLVLESGTSRLITVEKGTDYENRIETSSTIDVTEDGHLEFAGTITYHGNSALTYHAWLNFGSAVSLERMILIMLEQLNIKASTAELLADTHDFVKISYRAKADGKEIIVPRRGIIIDMPGIASPLQTYASVNDEGPRYIADFTQTDSWELPKSFSKLESIAKFNSLYAQGKWRRHGSTITRSFSQNEAHIPVADINHLRSHNEERNRFSKATIWR